MRKSRREKEQEAVEAKKREEEANAAKAYAEFIDAFEGEDAGRRKSGTGFVKASTEPKATYIPPEKGTLEHQSRTATASNRVRHIHSPSCLLLMLSLSHLHLCLTLHRGPKESVQWMLF